MDSPFKHSEDKPNSVRAPQGIIVPTVLPISNMSNILLEIF